MDIARELYNNNLTPGELCLQLLDTGKKFLPDFYRSDLQNEFDEIWKKQKEYYPESLLRLWFYHAPDAESENLPPML